MFLSKCTRARGKQEVKPECIVTTNPDRSVLITIITWDLEFHLMNAHIPHLKGDHRGRSESHFACFSIVTSRGAPSDGKLL